MKAYILDTENAKYFQSDVFGSILNYVKLNPKSCQLKEVKNMLVMFIQNVSSVPSAIEKLNSIV